MTDLQPSTPSRRGEDNPCCGSAPKSTPCCDAEADAAPKPCRGGAVDANPKPCCGVDADAAPKPCCGAEAEAKPKPCCGVDPEAVVNPKPCCGSGPGVATVSTGTTSEGPLPPDDDLSTVKVVVHGVTCTTCARKVEKFVVAAAGMVACKINYMTQKGVVKYDRHSVSVDDIIARIGKVGHDAEALNDQVEGELTLSYDKKTSPSNFTALFAGHFEARDLGVLNVESVSGDTDDLGLFKVSFDAKRMNPREIVRIAKDTFRVELTVATSKAAVSREALLRTREIRFYAIWFAITAVLTIPIFILSVGLGNIPALNKGTAIVNGTEEEVGIYLSYPIYKSITPVWLAVVILVLPILLVAGCHFYVLGFKALFLACSPDKNTLISVSSWMAFITSIVAVTYSLINGDYQQENYFKTTAILICFLHLGSLMENLARRKTSSALLNLMDLQPEMATIVDDNYDNPEVVPLGLVSIGDILRVSPGEKVPTDGTIVRGSSMVSQAVLTGESAPVFVDVGNQIFGGTINMDGVVYAQVDVMPGENVLSKIIDLIARFYVPFILIFSLATYFLWVILVYFAIPSDWVKDAIPWIYAVLPATSILVTACPCAMGIAIPILVLVASGVAASHGVLFRSGAAFEALSLSKTICFDKTGTLTQGKVEVRSAHFVGMDKDYWKEKNREFLMIVGAAELSAARTHPLARVLVEYAKEQLEVGDDDFRVPEDLVVVAGKGVSCKVSGEEIRIGSRSFLKAEGVDLSPLDEEAETVAEIEGFTRVFVGIGGELVSVLSFDDPIREDALEVVTFLREKGKVETYMLTGDNESVAIRIAAEVGIPLECVKSGLSPAGKADFVRDLQSEEKGKQVVTFCGDGINDAIALSSANIGVSVGSGTEIAMDCADIVLMSPHLSALLVAFDVAKKSWIAMILNVIWAFVYNILALPIAAGALYYAIRIVIPPWSCVIVMTASNLCVILNTLLFRCLYRYRGPGHKKLAQARKEEVQAKKAEKIELKRMRKSGKASESEGETTSGL